MKLNQFLPIAAIVALSSCATTQTYQIQAKSGTETSGEVSLSEKDGEVELKLNVHNLDPNSVHAAHIHEFGDCSSDDAKSAGGHWSPQGNPHGKWGNGKHHAGDLGNLKTDENGNASLTIKSDLWCLDCIDDKMNIKGKAIVIHAKADDFTSQPAGNAGDRVGCAELK